ncbi:GATA zinc finger domain-containing protein 21-like [Drosophila albomicans]|uniref:GATA zinc finger domain-containing protein 21-like n=1 Tax=Drosophila albomicans TaxID=7291 RepID=A0A9C6WFR3_DROAB|nr:GATA zinc finger domain-containing protein 21-like [Drosophila albomicans]
MQMELELEMENENENEKASISNEKYNNNNNSNNNGNTGHNANSSNRGTMWRPWPLNTTEVSSRRLFAKVQHVLPGFIAQLSWNWSAHNNSAKNKRTSAAGTAAKAPKAATAQSWGFFNCLAH